METMTDREFLNAIYDRLREKGWTTGRIGTCEGPNCIVGAAGFLAHPDLVVDEDGINPIRVGDVDLITEDDSYDFVPGMLRLAKILGFDSAFTVSSRINDVKDHLSEVEIAAEAAYAEASAAE